MLCAVQVDPSFRTFDYDGKALKKPLRKVCSEVRKVARKLIARKQVSKPGELPGRKTGEMARSIRVRVSKAGYSSWVEPSKTDRMPAYYPAFVVYGHRAPYAETADQARKHRKRPGVKVALPRENFIFRAAEIFRPKFEATMAEALADAIKPGVI